MENEKIEVPKVPIYFCPCCGGCRLVRSWGYWRCTSCGEKIYDK